MGKAYEIDLDDYTAYYENRGVITCKKCGEQLWCSILEEDEIIECYKCDTKHIYST